MSVIAVIPARYGSQRFPGKPLADLGGKPVIQHVVERVKSANLVDEVIVATDDTRIREAVESFGGRALMTSSNANSGTERVAEVARQHSAKVIINVQGDEPLVHPEMVDSVVEYLKNHAAVPMASLMTELKEGELENPNVVKVVVDRGGFAIYFSRSPIPFKRTSQNKETKLSYKHIGIYGYQRQFLLKFPQLEPTALEQSEQLEQLRALEHGYRIKLMETKYDTAGVDTPEDLKKVEELLTSVPKKSVS